MPSFIDRIDPSHRHHIELGHQAADYLFKFCPAGEPPQEFIDKIEAQASHAIRQKLEPLGATHDDLVAAVLITAAAFGQRYKELVSAYELGGAA